MTPIPPRCLDGFVAAPASDPDVELDTLSEDENRFFSIGCACGNSHFAVHSYFNPHYYLENETAYGPIELRCTACQTERLCFSPFLHGYDVEIDHFPPDDNWRGESREFACPACTSAAMSLVARFEYQESIIESMEAGDAGSSESRPRPRDMFSYFTLIGTCRSCGTKATISSVECA